LISIGKAARSRSEGNDRDPVSDRGQAGRLASDADVAAGVIPDEHHDGPSWVSAGSDTTIDHRRRVGRGRES
jgi:hypothetical protein